MAPAVPRAEACAQASIRADLDAAKLCLDKNPADTRRAEVFLDSARLSLRDLSQNTLHRVSGYQVDEDLIQATAEWNSYRIPIMIELDELADL